MFKVYRIYQWRFFLIPIFVFNIGFISFLQGQSIYINEFMASNHSTINDEEEGYDDWVELHNTSTEAIDVGGMYLTDDLSDLIKWQIPDTNSMLTTIESGGYLIFWFDGNPEEGVLHTKLKLSASGEQIGLISADGISIIDSLTYGKQLTDISFGREAGVDGEVELTFFINPSPGSINSSVGSNLIKAPIPSVQRGHYDVPLSIDLTSLSPDVDIYYTLNGDTPTANDFLYDDPISIDETRVLRAIAIRGEDIPSQVMTHTYLFNVEHNFPIVCLSTNDDHFFGEEAGIYENYNEDIEHPAHVELFEADGSFGFHQDLGISLHGSYSVNHPQKGLALVARREYGSKEINYPLFPDLPYDEYGSFILRASGNDYKHTMFRDALASSLLRDKEDVENLIQQPDLDLQGYRPTAVYLNGDYFGIHNLREKMDWRYFKTHFDIDKEDLDLIQGFKSVQTGNDETFDEYFNFIDDNEFDGPENIDSLEQWLKIDHYLDYILFNVYVDNTDWPDTNNKHWRERKANRQWRYLIYDLDKGFGLDPLSENHSSGDWDSESLDMVLDDDHDYDHNSPWSTLVLRKLFENDEIRKRFITRMADMLNILYTKDRVINRVNNFEALYLPEWEKHDAVWDFQDEEKWLDNVNETRIFAMNRDSFLWQHFADYFDDINSVVNLTLQTSPASAGDFHLNTMTLPSDIPWEGQYFAGIEVPLSVIPKRGFMFDRWTGISSEPTETETTMLLENDQNITAHFIQGSTSVGDLVINEINYNSSDQLNSGDWVELYNNTSEPIDLSAWYFEDESEYFNLPVNTIIQPNEYLVLVEDSLKFKTIFQDVDNYIGSFGKSLFGSFKLNNGGELIRINNADASFKDEVHYDDLIPWPELADGYGPTLQLIHPDMDNALAESWVSQAANPGESNEVQPLDIDDQAEIESSFLLFPNPASEQIQLDISQMEIEVQGWSIYNSLGQLIAKNKIRQDVKRFELDIKNYAKGIYWVQLEFKSGRKLSRKFLKINE